LRLPSRLCLSGHLRRRILRNRSANSMSPSRTRNHPRRPASDRLLFPIQNNRALMLPVLGQAEKPIRGRMEA